MPGAGRGASAPYYMLSPLTDFVAALERLGSREDWCSTAGAAQALPKIGRS